MMPPAPPRTLFVGSFPPRECGIATFTHDVVESFDACFGVRSDVVAIEEAGSEGRVYPRRVVATLRQEDRGSHMRAAEFANRQPYEMVNVQHEYGLFGGDQGVWFLDFLKTLEKPVVVSMHTVLPDPDEFHLKVAQQICALASSVVVLSRTGRDLLVDRYGVDPAKVLVIHHGVPDVPFETTDRAKKSFGVGDRMVISTFGLISRGKGLEYAIEAMKDVVASHPEALYLILGETHPQVRRREGESYRESLQALIKSHGVEANVRLVNHYLEFDELVEYLRATDIYLTPYLNPAQVVSGTLAYAIGCGKAVVSTPYLYAKELLAFNRGLLAEFRDPISLAHALKSLLGDPALRQSIERRAYRFGRRMTWPHVAMEYGELFAHLEPERESLLQPA